MKRFIRISCLYAMFHCAALAAPAHGTNAVPAAAEGVTCIIPINGIIESGLLVYVVRKGVAEALEQKAGAIVFEMDTPGGELDVTEEIVRLLIDLPPNVRTCTFVNKDALSAGALIALATDEIYMAPGSRIGASAIVSIFGDLPEGDMKAKMNSATLSLMRRAAVANGYDEKLVEAMILKESGYKIGEEVICEPGRLLTLNDIEASRTIGTGAVSRVLLAKGTANDLGEVIGKLGRTGTRLVYFKIGRVEKIARALKALQLLFLVGGIVGFYIEFKTPGFGLPGIAGILCLVVFFWAQYAAGLAGAEEFLLLALGVALLLIELFLLPGFGAAGTAGIICVTGAAVMAMFQHYPGTPWHRIPESQFREMMMTLAGGAAGAAIAIAILARYLPKTSLFNKISLATSTSADLGFVATEKEAGLLGRKGVASSPLHPAGTGAFGEDRLQVVTRGDFLDENTPIVIVEVKGNRIVVEKREV